MTQLDYQINVFLGNILRNHAGNSQKLFQEGNTVSTFFFQSSDLCSPSLLGWCTDVQKKKIHTNYNSQLLRIARILDVSYDTNCRFLCNISPDCVAWTRKTISRNSCHLLKDHDLLSATNYDATFNIGKRDCGSCVKSVLRFTKAAAADEDVQDLKELLLMMKM